MITLETSTYLGPASVSSFNRPLGEVRVVLPWGEDCRARLALGWPYSPAKGDEVLVIGQDLEKLYVIGVLRSEGTTRWRVPGSLSIEAPEGGIRLSAGSGIELHSRERIDTTAPVVSLRAGCLEIVARRLIEKAGSVYAWVSGLFQLKSRRLRAVTESTVHVKGERVYLKSDKQMHLKGETINLG